MQNKSTITINIVYLIIDGIGWNYVDIKAKKVEKIFQTIELTDIKDISTSWWKKLLGDRCVEMF